MSKNKEPAFLFDKIAVVGVGLLGGSAGLAAKKYNIAEKIVGIGRNPEKLKRALECGAIDEYTLDIEEGAEKADFILLCTPISKIIDFMDSLSGNISPGTIITDVGSTKKNIVTAANRIFKEDNPFIGSHPMAGSEKSGVEYADADLYKNRVCLLTPDQNSNITNLAKVCAFWQRAGSRIVILNPERHDELIGQISHLPHLAAVSLVKTIADGEEEKDFLKHLCGQGFLDTTRIAAGSYDMWRDILFHNKDVILKLLDNFNESVNSLKKALEDNDYEQLETIFKEAIELRKSFNDK